jgi:2',3'-cyclic-nucleotide 2'-phosphodiesterase / 3'-nucleotidase
MICQLWGDKVIKDKKKAFIILLLFCITCLSTFKSVDAEENTDPIIRVRILETTDLHANMLGYDYVNKETKVDYGLQWTATLIKQARKEVANSLLFDVGDVLVGNAVGEYVLKTHLFNWMAIHPVYKVLNLLGYDAATVGNHEFNYGLDFLVKSLKGAKFPYINANIYVDDHNDYEGDDLNFFNPYTIIEKDFTDSSGRKYPIKIGVIGLITPIAAVWDKETFVGNLKIKNMKATAEHFVPIMKDQGADIIVALVHSGLEADVGLKDKKGNSVYSVSKVDGIDAILYGHSHSLFPNSDKLPLLDGIDVQSGTINGTAAVQAGYWGNHLGIIDLDLAMKNGKWEVIKSQSKVKPIYRTVKERKIPVAPSDQVIERAIEKEHRQILEYLKILK